jgi:hypothetical protein
VEQIPMKVEPTNKTAALAGAWSVFGLVPLEQWMNHSALSALEQNLYWICGCVVFLIVPAIYFVVGRKNAPTSRTWFLDPDQRAQRLVIAKRGFCWLVSAGFVGSVWSLLLAGLTTH